MAVRVAAVQHPHDPHDGEGRRRGRRSRSRPRRTSSGPTSRSTPAGFLGALVTQALVGITLGLFTMILVNALQAAGALVDLFAGFSLAAIYDPINQSNVAIFGRFYELIAVTLLFTTNAYLLLVNGWFRSFKVVPAHGLVVRRPLERADEEPRAVPRRRGRGRGPGARLPVPRRGDARSAVARRAEPQRVLARVPVARASSR